MADGGASPLPHRGAPLRSPALLRIGPRLTSPGARPETSGMYHGWKIVGVAFLTQFVSIGFVFYSYGVFFKPLAAEFGGGGRLGVAFGLTAMNVATAAFAPFLGRLLDRGSIRDLMRLGACLMGLGFLVASRVSSLPQFYVVVAFLLGIGGAMMGAVAGSTLVSNWFVERRGAALGISTMGISLSGMVMAPVSTILVERMGWRHAFVVYGLLTVSLVLPAVSRWVVDRPEDMGLLPDGHRPGEESHAEWMRTSALLRLSPWSARRTLSDRRFWIIAVVMGLNMCCNNGILTHMIPHVTDLGMSPERAAWVLSAGAGMGVLGKVFFGWITDRADQRLAVWFCSGLQAAGVLMLVHSRHMPGLLISSAIYGFGMGGVVPLWATLVGATFERAHFGRAMGLMSPFMMPLHVFGTPFAGLVFDRLGSYDVAFETFIGMYLFSMLLLAALPLSRPQRANVAPPSGVPAAETLG